jgi:uncharacterized membrane protein
MKRPRRNLRPVFVAAVGIAYPFVVYAFVGRVAPWAFLALMIALALPRLAAVRKRIDRRILLPGAALGGALLVLYFLKDAMGAVRLYPVLMSLGVAGAFAASLIRPPTLIERFARLSRPDLPEAGVRYARHVTWVWFVFLTGNAAVAAWTVFWGTLAQWMLWNGLISYLLMGGLFAGEYLIRKAVLP